MHSRTRPITCIPRITSPFLELVGRCLLGRLCYLLKISGALLYMPSNVGSYNVEHRNQGNSAGHQYGGGARRRRSGDKDALDVVELQHIQPTVVTYIGQLPVVFDGMSYDYCRPPAQRLHNAHLRHCRMPYSRHHCLHPAFTNCMHNLSTVARLYIEANISPQSLKHTHSAL